MQPTLNALEQRLNDFDPRVRAQTLDTLVASLERGAQPTTQTGRAFNLHSHTFFSFNGYGLSPTAVAWLGRRDGLYAMGTVDFDVLDAVDEFLRAARRLSLRCCAGLETRVYVEQFGDRVINSPGEPGIAYHMGAGFVRSSVNNPVFLVRLKQTAQQRNKGLVERVNAYLDPVTLDYERDVVPLTPAGNATERHVCTAYDKKAQAMFPRREARLAFWSEKLGIPEEKLAAALDDAPTFQGLIRSKTMKAGGAGYVRPEGPDFPRLEDVNAFVRENGAIPTFAWLDGSTAGEQALDELLDLMVASGVLMVNIIPDRNWNIADSAEREKKVANLDAFIAAAKARNLPIMAGTEMNAYGQPFVDNFDAEPMQPHYDTFLQGVHVLHGHTVLQFAGWMGYTSTWAEKHFPSLAERVEFYAKAGAKAAPRGLAPDTLHANMSPGEVLGKL